jgi:Nif-specific regulatory protein
MNPRLIAMAGPLKGAVIKLTHGAVSIGREPFNQLCLNDPLVSRRHCLIVGEGARFKLNDLESSNGAFVNGLPVKERYLRQGDLIALGDSLFLFLLDEEIETTPGPDAAVQFYDGGGAQATTLLREEAFYLRPEKVVAALPQAARVARGFNALLQISAAINSIRSLDALARRLLELIFEVIPAERGAVLLVGEDLEKIISAFTLDRRAGPERQIQVSRTVTGRVLRERVAVLSRGVLQNESLREIKSLTDFQVESLLTVPLAVFDKVIGVIYLDTSEPDAPFDEESLQLLTAIASVAAVTFENVGHVARLEQEARRLQSELNLDHDLIGESEPMRRVYHFISKVASSEATVLIRGESGTGKELVARALHRNSPRARRPFIAINCAALADTLLESEIFGHEKGAFTGAVAQKKGLLEAADGGTVFLDELGELSPLLQAKLLRVLQERQFERVGGTQPIKVDIRLIAATNRDLEEAIKQDGKQGGFRADLYYRLNIVSVMLPPLRERRDDIPLLASYFLAKHSKKCNRAVRGLSPEARSRLLHYDWPGNVRELENAIERAVVLGSSDRVMPEDLPETALESEPPPDVPLGKYHEAMLSAKKQLLRKAVAEAGGNYVEAARLLGIQPTYLHRLMRNLDLKAGLKK